MVKRLVIGLVKGLVVGAVAAALLVRGLHLVTFSGAWLAYLAAVVTGVLVGLVAGKPIWARGARIEAGLKAFAGALLSAGAMFAVRRWLGMHIDLSSLSAGAGAIGQLPATSLPIVATVLSVIFELDNTGGDDEDEGSAKKQSGTKARIEAGGDGAEADELEEELESGAGRARRKG